MPKSTNTGSSTPAKANDQKGTKFCTCCKHPKKVTDFYYSASPLYALDERVPVCKECCKTSVLNDDGTIDFDKFKELLRNIDKPLYFDLLYSSETSVTKENSYLSDEEVSFHGMEILQKYFTLVAMRQDKTKSYSDAEKEGFIHQNSNRSKEEKTKILNKYSEYIHAHSKSINISPQEKNQQEETKWSKKDKQNMKYVISTVGYDPFEDLGLNESDRKYCFNIMAGYCDTDGIVEDGNKMQGVIEMTNMYCQCKNFTTAINEEMRKDEPNDQKIARLTSSKTSMLSSISTIAKDNNIASNYNKNSKQGQNSLTSKMKEMSENDFEAIRVNLFDIKTSEAFKQIDKISNENIANQLTLDNSEFSDIVKEQREIIQEQESAINILQEENRNLKNKIIDLETKKR